MEAPPAQLMLQVSNVDDATGFIASARSMSSAIVKHLGKVERGARVLDFGCGVGKALIGLSELRPDLELHGCDLDGSVVEWCLKNTQARVVQNELQPPLPYPDSYFDVINAVSVFTHLSLEHAFRWAWELHRVLKPGGTLHFTTHGEAFFSLFCDVASRKPVDRITMRRIGSGDMLELVQPIPDAGEGQRSVAVAHSAAAIDEIFSPFARARHFRECSIGNGHDAYLLTRPAGPSVLHGPWSVRDDFTGRGVTLAYNVEGQRRFRVYLASVTEGVIETAPAIKAVGNLNGREFICQELRPFPGARMVGSKVLYPIEIQVPGDGLLTVNLATKKLDRWLEAVEWVAPHLH
jgi:ubiquinone/menaquinone biosynthesis C-methylase UbiE